MALELVAELRSETDCISLLPHKRQERAGNGMGVGRLIDRIEKRVEIDWPGKAQEILDALMQISGDPELPGFVLDLTRMR